MKEQNESDIIQTKQFIDNINERLDNVTQRLENATQFLESVSNKLVNNMDNEMLKQIIAKIEKPISDFDLTIRTKNALRYNGEIKYIFQLISCNKKELSKFRNLGAKSLDEILDFLKEQNLDFISNMKQSDKIVYQEAIYYLEKQFIKKNN